MVEAESAILLWLTDHHPSISFATRTPDDLQSVMPFGLIERIGGTDAVHTLDEAFIDVEVFAATRTDARTAAESVRTSLRYELPGQMVTDHLGNSGPVSDVRTVTAPISVPYANDATERFTATYAVTIHSS